MGKVKKSAPEGFSNWRDYVKRIANTHGLAHEVLLEFDWGVSAGETPELAAQRALSEWIR